MTPDPRQITLAEWDGRRRDLLAGGLREPSYGGALSRHLADGDRRLSHLRFDDSAAALRLWNLLLTEEDRLADARAAGRRIVGAMKDLGTVPVMAFSRPELVAFYPDGAWWTPCVMEMEDGLFRMADELGIPETFCPVRAMLGAFVSCDRFPIPDLLVCSAGATCDDFSAIAQRLEDLGHAILWWEIPHRRRPGADEEAVRLAGGLSAPRAQVEFVAGELERVREALERLAGGPLDQAALAAGIRRANAVRAVLAELRHLVFSAPRAPLPALELLVAEMLALHFCSDYDEALATLTDLRDEVRRRVTAGIGLSAPDAVRVFWINPVADLRVMNQFEEKGGRLCGTDFMFSHALEPLDETLPPMEALARAALADPLAGPASDRAGLALEGIRRWGAEAVVISRIPGASHCAGEGVVIGQAIRGQTGLPVVEIEVPPLSDSVAAALDTRLGALMETARARRSGGARVRQE